MESDYCGFCGKKLGGGGRNNPYPLSKDGSCCHECDAGFVWPVRDRLCHSWPSLTEDEKERVIAEARRKAFGSGIAEGTAGEDHDSGFFS